MNRIVCDSCETFMRNHGHEASVIVSGQESGSRFRVTISINLYNAKDTDSLPDICDTCIDEMTSKAAKELADRCREMRLPKKT